MQTRFSPEQLKTPRIALADEILRKCVHCGFCTATCPTYVLRGDELDSPRGRIYQIKEMFETGGAASPQITKHLDRCLSCLSCMTTCPSGVHYMHLVDEARAHVEATGDRPAASRLQRWALTKVLPYPKIMRPAMALARLFRFAAPVFETVGATRPLAAMLRLAPRKVEPPELHSLPGMFPTKGERKGRVALLAGCANAVLEPNINAATVRVLNRAGYDVVVAKEAGCCGSLEHHMGKEDASHAKARANIEAWTREIETGGLDAIIINASGCGTTVKDYGHMFRNDPDLRDQAAAVSALARDISEFVAELGDLDFAHPNLARVAYHDACSLQHGQKVRLQPRALLKAAGFEVEDLADAHLCCGSAGVYNIFQPEIAGELKDRKLAAIAATKPDYVATGNIGCMTQLADGAGVPVYHTIELIDWAQSGQPPRTIS